MALKEVFPNPCTDQIKLSLTETRDTNIKIFAALGGIIYEYVVTGKEATIDTHGRVPKLCKSVSYTWHIIIENNPILRV